MLHPEDIGTNVANPIDKDDIIGDAEQIQLTNMQASAVELRARGEELYCTYSGEHISQFDLQGISDFRSLLIGFATLDNTVDWQKHCNSYQLRQYNRRCQVNTAVKYASQCSALASIFVSWICEESLIIGLCR